VGRVIRHPLWRRACAAACLPYVLAALLVDFVHLQPPPGAGISIDAVGSTVQAGPSSTTPADDGAHSCPACAWLRIGQRVETQLSFRVAIQASIAQIGLLETRWCDSPVPRHTALRGPPPHTLS
jgi:hypothetical protein